MGLAFMWCLHTWSPYDSWWRISLFQRKMPISAVNPFKTWKLWNENLEKIRSQHSVCLEDASLYWKESCSWKRRRIYQGARVVKDLVKEIQNSGRNVTCNKFFYHHPTFSRSAEKEAYSSRNYSEEQTELPPQFTVAKGREIASTIFGFQNDAMIT